MLDSVKLCCRALSNLPQMEKGYAAVPTPEANLTSKEMLQRAASKSPERIWHDSLDFLQAELPRQFFDTWVRDAEPLHFEGDVLVLNVSNEFAQEKLQKDYRETIRRIVSMVVGHAVDVHVVVNNGWESNQVPYPMEESVQSSLLSKPDILESPDADPRLELMLQFRRHWERIVDPERVVSISRYFVKYWLPVLGPDFSSTVLAFKQLRYLHHPQAQEPFQIYVSELLEWQGISKSTFYRRMENPHPLLSWFVEEAPSLGAEYEKPAPGKIRQKPKQYLVYAGTPLSPPHQLAIRNLLLELGADRDLAETVSALEAALKTPGSDLRKLLDDSFAEYMEKGNTTHPHKAMTVLDIVLEILGIAKGDPQVGRVSILSEQLENRIVRPDQVTNLTWYFVREWQSLLKSSAFWLIVLLRSMGFYDKRTSEIRNTFWIDGGFCDLAHRIGSSSETISGWFGGNRKSDKTNQSEYVSLFVHEIERSRGRNGDNPRSISLKLSVEMVDPLTPAGELQFYNLFQEEGKDFKPLSAIFNNYPEKWDSRDGEYPEIWDSSPSDHPELWDSASVDIPEKRDSRMSHSPEIWDSKTPDSPELWDSLKDSQNTTSVEMTKDKNTFQNTTTKSVNQLLLPMIYSSETQGEDQSCRSSGWDLEKLLMGNSIPPDKIRSLLDSGIRGQDFAAWVLYAYSSAGRGIENPGFFAVNRLLENPPILAQERWIALADKGPDFVMENIQSALDPLGEDVDKGWGDVMGKVSKGRLQQLERVLCL